MHLDFASLSQAQAYKILTALVAPRPIALVTTMDAHGLVNAAPFSFFNVMGTVPPIVVFGPGDRDDGTPKDTAANLMRPFQAGEAAECVIHLVDEAVAQAMADCAWPHPPGVSELPHAGFTPLPSLAVKPPRLAEAPLALECRVLDIRQYGDNRLIVAQILHAHVRDGILNPPNLRLNPGSWTPVGRMESPDGYCRTADKFKMLPREQK